MVYTQTGIGPDACSMVIPKSFDELARMQIRISDAISRKALGREVAEIVARLIER